MDCYYRFMLYRRWHSLLLHGKSSCCDVCNLHLVFFKCCSKCTHCFADVCVVTALTRGFVCTDYIFYYLPISPLGALIVSWSFDVTTSENATNVVQYFCEHIRLSVAILCVGSFLKTCFRRSWTKNALLEVNLWCVGLSFTKRELPFYGKLPFGNIVNCLLF